MKLKYFVPSKTGFKQMLDAPADASVNAITEHLGLHKDTVFSFWHETSYTTNRDVAYVLLEVFSKNIVCVAVRENVKGVSSHQLSLYLDKLEEGDILESYEVEERLKTAIENESFRVEFLTRILGLKYTTPTGVFFSEKLDKYLFFTDSILTDYQLADGLGVWAKTWKQVRPDLLASQQATASYYWGNNYRAILAEINRQADAWADIPAASNNKHIDLHRNHFGAVNFEMLQVCHYKRDMKLHEFVITNHGRYQRLPSREDATVYGCGIFAYHFDSEGNIIDVTLR